MNTYKGIRYLKGHSVLEVAEAIGIHKKHIESLEAGEYDDNLVVFAKWVRLAAYYGRMMNEISWVISGQEDEDLIEVYKKYKEVGEPTQYSAIETIGGLKWR